MAEPIVSPQTEALLAEFTRSGLRELHVRTGETEIFLSNDPTSRMAVDQSPQAIALQASAASVSTAPVRATTAPDIPSDAIIVRAPNLGTFYGAPKPGADAYVVKGSTVSVGAELCLIEVMKLFTAVHADVDGRVHAILAADGEMVEAGQPLFAIVRT
jgi:acetyl-CoA carboxylase biotin carboxyl carrier protein